MPVVPFERTRDPTLRARVGRAAGMAYMDGLRDPEIARTVGIKATTLRDWKRRPEWQDAINALREAQRRRTEERLCRLAERAVQAIEQSLACDNPAIKLRAATWVLERADIGGARPDESQTAFEAYLSAELGGDPA